MQSTKTKVEDFLRSRPNCKDFFNDLIKKEEDKINEEMGKYEKEDLVEKAKKLLEYDTANFKTSLSEGFKYKLEVLNNDDSDYKLLESSFESNRESENDFLYGKIDCNSHENDNVLNIYRVVPTNETSNNSGHSNMLLLHGTKAPNVEGILRTGFKPSETGTYGAGVYLLTVSLMRTTIAEVWRKNRALLKDLDTFL